MNSAVQSPIALSQRSSFAKDTLPPLEYFGHFDDVGIAEIQNTGTSVMITFKNRPVQPFITGGPLTDKYIFEQLHFHWADHDDSGCEHIIDGSRFSMEAHAVHYNSKYSSFKEAVDKPDGLAVTGYFLQASGDLDFLDFSKVSNAVGKVTKSNSTARLEADCLSWIEMQELEKHYYSYKGSLTTSPYFESVTWIVYRSPIYVSRKQINIFRQLEACPVDKTKKIVNNYREVQQPKTEPEIIFARNVYNINVKSKL